VKIIIIDFPWFNSLTLLQFREVYHLVIEIAPMINNNRTVKERQAGRREKGKIGGKCKLH
jgi:hypothetical protein